ncbi:MAG: Uma2 family endonuclease [Rudanella sp.]|nr:Uma2 family endonuclease [Rudanella sp.]
METVATDLIEEFHSEDIMSVNHSKLIHRLSVTLDRYEDQYDILPELELELPTGKCKPDVAIYEKIGNNWFNDIIYYTQPPLIAVEVLSPKQGVSDLTDKAFKVYFPAGVKTVWIIAPMLHIVQVILPNGTQLTWPNGVMKDPVLGFEVDVDVLLR